MREVQRYYTESKINSWKDQTTLFRDQLNICVIQTSNRKSISIKAEGIVERGQKPTQKYTPSKHGGMQPEPKAFMTFKDLQIPRARSGVVTSRDMGA